MNIGTRLNLGFGALVFLTAVVGVVAIIAGQLESQAVEAVIDARRRSDFGRANSNRGHLQARLEERNFLEAHSVEGFETAFNTYVVANQEYIANAVELVEEFKASEAQDEVEDERRRYRAPGAG